MAAAAMPRHNGREREEKKQTEQNELTVSSRAPRPIPTRSEVHDALWSSPSHWVQLNLNKDPGVSRWLSPPLSWKQQNVFYLFNAKKNFFYNFDLLN